MRRYSHRVLMVSMLVASTVCHGEPPTPEQLQFFENEVRPILATHCYECHSVDAKKLQAGLRLDSRAGMLRGGDSGGAIVPDNPEASLLMSAVRYDDFEMPPTGKLEPSQIASLEKWIEIGAPWPEEPEPVAKRVAATFDWRQRAKEHWCWHPINKVQPPEVADQSWCRNPIDNFILSKLDAVAFKPAKDAEKRTLLRRLYFGLIGFPPTPEQVIAFVNDDSDDAYEKVVDGLLRSPQFGEKWTRHWLDLVRYGETLGHEFDYPLEYAYQYRDYLIRALNHDVPYDQLVREHIAGDLLKDPRLNPSEAYNESIIGTGFWFLGEAVHAPTDVKADEADRVDNQIDVMSKAFLGLTVACARCHDHKFDPIPTTDYYALAGYLQSSRRQIGMLDPRGEIHRLRNQLEASQIRGRQVGLKELGLYASKNADEQATLRQALREKLQALFSSELIEEAIKKPTHPLYALVKLSHSGDKFSEQRSALIDQLRSLARTSQEQFSCSEQFVDFGKDSLKGWFRTGEAFATEPTQAMDWQPFQIDPITPAGLAHSGLYGTNLRGVLRSPTFVLKNKRIHYRLNARSAGLRLIVDGYTMDEFNALLFVDNTKRNVTTKEEFKWVTQEKDIYHYVGHRAHIEIIDNGNGFVALDQIRFSDDAISDPPHELNLALLTNHGDSFEQLLSAYVDRIVDTLMMVADARDATDVDLANWAVRSGVVPIPESFAALAENMRALDSSIPSPISVIALTDGDGENERVFIRGSHKNLGDEAPRRMLVALGGEDAPAPIVGSGRLELAHQMTDPTNPLTARVAVNRLWHHLFGRGIVPSVDDFGRMGQPPSHPELLDWLANDFIKEQKWSLKQAIRQIVLSRTYRMSSEPNADPTVIAAKDPNNVLLHRAPVRRLAGEAIRDALLSLSGRLDLQMYGPSVRVHLTPFMEGRGRPTNGGPLDGDGRRSLYVEVRRNFLSPMMLAFDTPSPFNAMGRRSNSNVPAQSLILMNSPFVLAQAQNWAKRLLDDQSLKEDSDRINHAFEMAFARKPTADQLERCEQFLTSSSTGEGDHETAWHDLCHMLINMKPFIFVN